MATTSWRKKAIEVEKKKADGEIRAIKMTLPEEEEEEQQQQQQMKRQNKNRNKKKKRLLKFKAAEEAAEEAAKVTKAELEQEVKIKIGQHVDVKALLSSESRDFLVTTKGNDSVPIHTLLQGEGEGKGNYVLVCCMSVPFDLESKETRTCRSLEALFDELSKNGLAPKVKLVLVGKTPPGACVPNFDDFFSKLSLNCLAIPYSDSQSRDNVCKLLQLSEWNVPCLVVHPTGLVLQLGSDFLTFYGAQSYPFTMDHFHNIALHDNVIRCRILSKDNPISHVQLLQCDSLSQIGTNVSIHPFDLDRDGDTVVGIYLYFYGYFMSELQTIHQTCRDKGLKLEIVLLPVPFGMYSDPLSFYDQIKTSASKNTTSSSWWTMPFNDKICRFLWRLSTSPPRDTLIILPRSGLPGELEGAHFASFYGVDAYPFTRDTIIKRRLCELRSVTLEHLLGGIYYVSHSLHNKNVLLYLEYLHFKSDFKRSQIDKMVNETIPVIKVMYPDSEVIFVPLEPLPSSVEEGLKKRTWPILPQELCQPVINHLFKWDLYQEPVNRSLVAFGKDGRILSRTRILESTAAERLSGHTNSDTLSLFDDTLDSDIFRVMADHMDKIY